MTAPRAQPSGWHDRAARGRHRSRTADIFWASSTTSGRTAVTSAGWLRASSLPGVASFGHSGQAAPRGLVAAPDARTLRPEHEISMNGWPGQSFMDPTRENTARVSAAPSRRGSRPCLPDDLQRMPGGSPGAVLYLLPAGNTGRRDDRVLRLGPDGRKEPELADAHGQFVVLRYRAAQLSAVEPDREGTT